MEKLIFDSGIQEYELGGGVLRFNPADPNVYARFMDAIPAVEAIEADMIEKGRQLDGQDPAPVLELMRSADAKAKEELNKVFRGNDFNALLEGVNLMAVAGNGERVATNLMQALTPIVEAGTKRFAEATVAQAKANRAQRRAAQKGQP